MNQINRYTLGRVFLLSTLLFLLSFVWVLQITAVAPHAEADHMNYLPLVSSPLLPPNDIELELVAGEGAFDGMITDIASAGDDRLFVVERGGVIKVVLGNGTVLAEPFLDLQAWVQDDNWEEGMLGLAFHPDYANNGYFYVAYTGAGAFQVVVRRFSVSATNPNKAADPSSSQVVLIINKCGDEGGACRVHNGGDLTFGPDGYLYIPMGDGGPDPTGPVWGNAQGDFFNHSQSMNLTMGKILRIDVNQTAPVPPDCDGLLSGAGLYTIPNDNPYIDGPAGDCDEIWSSGLRNPWRISFDRDNGDMYVTDVGEWEYEEINYHPANEGKGANYGWHCYEGPFDYSTKWPQVSSDCGGVTYTFPVIAYLTQQGNFAECSVVGGFVYRGEEYPSLQGHYLFADFCSGRIWRTAPNGSPNWDKTELFQINDILTTFGEGVDGTLYVAKSDSFGGDNSGVFKIVVP